MCSASTRRAPARTSASSVLIGDAVRDRLTQVRDLRQIRLYRLAYACQRRGVLERGLSGLVQLDEALRLPVPLALALGQPGTQRGEP